MSDTAVHIGQIVRLPFHPDGNDQFVEYEIEAFVSSPANGAPAALLIQIRDGQREKTQRGHYRRETRSLSEIKRWVSA